MAFSSNARRTPPKFAPSKFDPSPTPHSCNNTRILRRTREISGSKPFLNEGRPDSSIGDENGLASPLKRRKSVTFENCIGSDEVRKQLGLLPGAGESEGSAIYEEPAQGEFQVHRLQGVSKKQLKKEAVKAPVMKDPKHMQFQPTLEPILSLPSSRRTSLHQSPGSQHPKTLKAEKDASDENEIHGGVEGQFHEPEPQEGTVRRRRSHMRTVSKDDYLLARGANPRTGMVTPGIHSASSSYEEEQTLKARGVLPTPKWRQRGEQWISLAPGQSTPLESPLPSVPRLQNTGRPLRTPPKLTAGRYGHGTYASNSILYPTSQQRAQELPTLGNSAIPGTFTLTPQKDISIPPVILESKIKPLIRRKPVGAPPTYQPGQEAHRPQRRGIPEPSMETVIMRPFANEQARSSSAPTLRTTEYFSPNDVGKELPALPTDPCGLTLQTHGEIERDHPFLGRRTQRWERGKVGWMEEIPVTAFATTSLNTFGHQLQQGPGGQTREEKTSQYPLTNNGRSQWHHLEEMRLNTLPRSFEMSGPRIREGSQMTGERTRRPFGSRGGDPTYPYVRPEIPPKQHRLDQQRRAGSGRPRMKTLVYDNQSRGRVHGPRVMNQSREMSRDMGGQGVQSDMITSPLSISTTSTSTDIHIPTSTSMSMNTRTRPNQHLPETCQGTSQNTERNMSMATSMYSSQYRAQQHMSHYPDFQASQIQPLVHTQTRPRGLSRHPMPDRGDGTNHVPRVNQQQIGDLLMDTETGMSMGPEVETSMGNRHQWRIIGTNNSNSTPMKGIAGESVTGLARSPLKLVSRIEDQHLGTMNKGMGREIDHHLGGGVDGHIPSSQPNGLTRNRSRLNASSAEHLRSTGGVTHMSENLQRQGFGRVSVEADVESPADANIEPEAGCSVASISPRRMTRADEEDERDHSICCPDCCRDQDCHEGCLGHPSPGLSPTRSTASAASSNISSATTSGEDSPLATRVGERGRLGFLRPALNTRSGETRGGFGRSGGDRRKEYGPPSPIIIEVGPEGPRTFWGGDGAGGVVGAVTAAKRAMGFKVTQAEENGIVVRKRTENQKSAPASTVIHAARAASEGGGVGVKLGPEEANANEARRVSSGPRLIVPTILTSSSGGGSRSRNVSGASLLSIDVPAFGNLSVGVVWEMLMVPLEAGLMWWKNHPEVRRWAWQVLQRGLEMGEVMRETAGRVWWVGRVYGKTGKLKMKGDLTWDVIRSVWYLGVFLGVTVLLVRVIGVVLGVVKMELWIVRMVLWVFGRVVGFC